MDHGYGFAPIPIYEIAIKPDVREERPDIRLHEIGAEVVGHVKASYKWVKTKDLRCVVPR